MTESFFDPHTDADGPKVYVGAHIPPKLLELLDEEAAKSLVSRSDVIRAALLDRYKKSNSGQDNENHS
jgi:metal-responsive CopG/Arc/MetJ family transcriptional regulator